MSGYLEVKYSFKSNLGFNPFKSWKRQWCILRPSPTCVGGGSLAVYCSEAGAAAGTVELPPASVVRRAKSRSRRHAFAVFTEEEPRKPRILLAAQSYQDAQLWMEKIRILLNGESVFGTESLLKDSYSVLFVSTELSRKCGLSGADGVVTLAPGGVLVSRSQTVSTFIDWRHVNDVVLITDTDKSKACLVTVDSAFSNGGGELKLSTPLASELVNALKDAARGNNAARRSKRLSKSESDLRSSSESDTGEVRRSSWYSGPSEVSLDDTDLAISKESKHIPSGRLSRSPVTELAPPAHPAAPAPRAPRGPHGPHGPRAALPHSRSCDDSISDRRSLLSIASGIYEEIPDLPAKTNTDTSCETGETDDQSELDNVYCKMSKGPSPAEGHDVPDGVFKIEEEYCEMGRHEGFAGQGEVSGRGAGPGQGAEPEEPTYECVSECVYATMRRAPRRCPPPPLPPRVPFGTTKLGDSWNSRINKSDDENNVTRHNSLGSLPRCYSSSAPASSKTLPKSLDKPRQTFSVFRKRLKSDSRLARSPKSETAKENKDVETKKKKFDFTPTKDIFKNFKVSRKMKNLKIGTSGLTKSETKSCECLDEAEHVDTGRCSKSVECLETEKLEDEEDFSIEFNDDAVAALALPQEIVELILRGRQQLDRIRTQQAPLGQELPAAPPALAPAPLDHHYMVMLPKANIA